MTVDKRVSLLSPSFNDDFIQGREHNHLSYGDLESDSPQFTKLAKIEEGCSVQRIRENEQPSFEKSIGETTYAKWCPNEFSIFDGATSILYQSTDLPSASGKMLRVFGSSNKKDFAVLFEDLSLHFIQNGQRMWKREESISQITQVESFD